MKAVTIAITAVAAVSFGIIVTAMQLQTTVRADDHALNSPGKSVPDTTDAPGRVRDEAVPVGQETRGGNTDSRSAGAREPGSKTLEPARTAPDESVSDREPMAEPGGTQTDLLDAARQRWRHAVETGRTDLGFREWFRAAIRGTIDDPAHAVSGTSVLDTSVSGTSASGQYGSQTVRRDGKTAAHRPGSKRNSPTPASQGTQSQADRTRRISGQWQKRAAPVALGKAGRVVTTYGEAIPTAFCSPLTVCYIELEAGEVLTDTPSWGDTARWQATVKVQGSSPETLVLEIKPSDDAGTTNMVIPTDRRLYTITLVNDADVHTPVLSFRYPDTAARKARERIAARKAATARAEQAKAEAEAQATAHLARTGLETETGHAAVEDLDFRFVIEGNAPFRPLRVYSDGRRTYMDLHPAYRGPLPVLVPGPAEENKVLNSRVTAGGTRLVADRVITDMWLQAGRQRVRVSRQGVSTGPAWRTVREPGR